jgi:hypothetical protein
LPASVKEALQGPNLSRRTASSVLGDSGVLAEPIDDHIGDPEIVVVHHGSRIWLGVARACLFRPSKCPAGRVRPTEFSAQRLGEHRNLLKLGPMPVGWVSK